MVLKVLLVMLGGGVGAAMRYGVGSAIVHNSESDFPWGTLAVNLLGCVGIGAFGALIEGPWPIKEEVRLLVMIGLLGGFTTFSSFGFETFELLRHDAYMKAAVYVMVSNALGISLLFVAFKAMRMIIGDQPT